MEDPGVGVQEDTADPAHLSLLHPGSLHVESLVRTETGLRPEILKLSVLQHNYCNYLGFFVVSVL